jgi:hypothetical protein
LLIVKIIQSPGSFVPPDIETYSKYSLPGKRCMLDDLGLIHEPESYRDLAGHEAREEVVAGGAELLVYLNKAINLLENGFCNFLKMKE